MNCAFYQIFQDRYLYFQVTCQNQPQDRDFCVNDNLRPQVGVWPRSEKVLLNNRSSQCDLSVERSCKMA